MMKRVKKYISENSRLMLEWAWEKNANLNPNSTTWKSDKKAWWICSECGFEWEAAVKNRSNGRGCPQCARNKQVQTFNQNRIQNNGSLATENPSLVKQWHPTKNGGLTPYDVTSKSGKKVWWLCERGHESESSISNHKGCPYCAGQKVWVGYNDLMTINPILASEWNLTKNISLSPCEVTANSGRKVWWQCSKGHEWQAKVL